MAFYLSEAKDSCQYLHINVGGGMNELNYQLQDGTQKGLPGFTINAAYSFLFTPHWGIQTGLGLQSFRALSEIDMLTKAAATDVDGEAYELRTYYTDWQEKQQVLYLDIPLTGLYRFALTEKISIQASAGAKVSFPLQTSFKTLGGEITTTGYYDQWNLELTDLPPYGFYTPSTSFSGRFKKKTSYMGVADLGGLVKLSDKTDLYVGGYLNYGLNNVLIPENKLIFEQNGTYNGALTSNQTNHVRPISVGLKVGLYWRIKEKMHRNVVDRVDLATKTELLDQDSKSNTNSNVMPVIDTTQLQMADASKIKVTEAPTKPKSDSSEFKSETIAVVKLEDNAGIELVKAQSLASLMQFHFSFNSDLPIHSEMEKVNVLCDYMISNPNAVLYIVGHTCNVGSRLANIRVGMKRALFVKKLFLQKGIPAERLIAVSKAYDQPLVPNTSVSNRKKNRRVEIKLKNKK